MRSKLPFRHIAKRLGWGLAGIALATSAVAEPTWFERESEHFVVIYRASHAHLVPHILRSAENALLPLMDLFDYVPSEKIVISTHDFSDYGAAGTTTVPHNFIRLDIEPMELGYENIPFNERLQWLISHELIHVVVNDQASHTESFSRSLFSKVPPEKNQPLSIFYSLLTNFGRYTPRWHQEGIAVFMETWLSGGFGRILGNFDEMYFRSMVLENNSFPSPSVLDGKTTTVSFLLQTLHYLYGARFVSYLASTYGTESLLDWFRTNPADSYYGFESKFKVVFGIDLQSGWRDFVEAEIRFQKENLRTLGTVPLTPVRRLSREALGWVTQPYVTAAGTAVFFGHHQPHQLTAIKRLDFKSRRLEAVGSLSSPSIIQVSSTAYDEALKLFFYTTNNSSLYRDIWVLSTVSKDKKLLFEDCRVGQLTVSQATHELWGVRHSAGKAILVYSPYPYRVLHPVVELPVGDELQHLAVSPSGKYLAATLHRSDGGQAIIVANCEVLKQGGGLKYQVVTDEGSPEHPSWSPDETTLFWNAFTNGVSNIYRYRFSQSRIEAVSHTLRGLFRPVYVNDDILFAFEFTTGGFVPVLLLNRVASRLPAIRYYGQKIVDRDPQVTTWSLAPAAEAPLKSGELPPEESYRALSRLQIHSLIPVVSGFQKRKVFGAFTHIADPLFVHDFSLEVGISPHNLTQGGPKLHAKVQYEYKRRIQLGLEHNAPNFYDLFNVRKRGMTGTKVSLGHTRYLKFDNPHKIKQTSELALYTGIEAINDNVVRVSSLDFLVFQSVLDSRNLRRSIGSSDVEVGTAWSVSLMGFLVDRRRPQLVGSVHAEWDRFSTFVWPHNVVHLKLAAGMARSPGHQPLGRFYFGGFGNRRLEDGKVKQFREVFRFPGVPIYSLSAQQFAKMMLEWNLPPLRFGRAHIGQHALTHIDASWYAQGLLLKSEQNNRAVTVGAQINLVFKHWFNLESTLSTGVARAWLQGDRSWAWFVSFKLLKG